MEMYYLEKKYNDDGNIITKVNYKKGTCKDYYSNGELKFEGEYKNGERNGNGKEYYYEGKIKFEG